MSLRKHSLISFCAAVVLFSPALVLAQSEIQFWHSLSGDAAARMADIADHYNQSQKKYKVVPVFKGGYADVMAALQATAQAGSLPHIVQVRDADSENLLAGVPDVKSPKRSKMLIKPLYQAMAEGAQKLDTKAYLPVVAAYYADKGGRMLALPFEVATPVLYVNRDAFVTAGMDPATLPKTWPQVQAAAQKIRDANAAPCGYTTASPAWIQMENLHAWNNEPFASLQNGFGGRNADLVFNDQIGVRHISLLSAWLTGILFTHAANAADAEAKFISGECALLTSSSAAYAEIRKKAAFAVAVAPLPYYEDFRGAPQNTLPGGSGLWAGAGKKPAEYRGIAEFFAYLARPEVQAEWQDGTGFLPMTLAGYELARRQGYYDRNPAAAIAMLQLTANRPGPDTRGIRLGQFAQIRAILDEEIESAWNHSKAPKQALDDAVRRGNELLRGFEKNNK